MWHAEKKKTSSNQQELQAIIRMKELLPINCDAESFADRFKEEMKKIKRSNNFEASYAYKAFIVDPKNVEIWKMKNNSDKNYLMFKLFRGDDIPGPFDHL
ncbi:hypothetical protein [Chryseobacterium sp.]|uniref:hypothetical protein n=1 Tax=Chryseobacterium sp. TaxID=1871047 RepID=UPI0028980350|nr:hypothetical protein [Chryseobacterium sp.]